MKTFILICVVALSAGIASAATIEEMAEMGRKGAPEAEMLKAVSATPAAFDMNAGEVLKLRDAKVPESVIAAMLTHTPGTTAPVAATATAPQQTAPPSPQTNGEKHVSSVADIVALAKGGANESQMIDAINNSGAVYPVGTAELIQLKQGGVSDKVIAETMAHQSHHSKTAFSNTSTVKPGVLMPRPTEAAQAQQEPNTTPRGPAAPQTQSVGGPGINSVDDVIALSKSGAPEADLLARVNDSGARFSVGATEILKLREANVSQTVIAEMIRHQAHHSDRAPQPLARPNPFANNNNAPAPAPRQNPQASGPGKITIDNLDNADWSYFYEPGVQTLWLTNPANDGRGTVHAHSSVTISMEPGLYQFRMLGSDKDGMAITVYGGDRSTIGLNRANISGHDVLQATVFERGERKGTGNLMELLPRETTSVEQPRTTTIYTESPSYYYYGVPYSSYGPRYYNYQRPYYHGYNSGIGIGIGIGGHRH